ncbi:testis-expressed protein 11-like isoform X2 [Clytia hemisphaerica]
MKLLENGESETHLSITEEQIKQCHAQMMQVFLFRAELALRNSQHATAMDFANKAKELVFKEQLKADSLCTASYNFGLECYQKELYNYSKEWLKQSIEIGKETPTVKSEQQASSRQLLALVYVELKGDDNYANALNVIEQSILEQPEVKSIHLKIKIKLLLNHDDQSVLSAFRDLSMHPQLELSLALQTVTLFSQNQRTELCLKALEILDRKYQQVHENIQVQLKRLELLLSSRKFEEAKDVIRGELIRANNHGKIFNKSSLKQLHLLLWEQANIAFENKEYDNCLYWYDCSLQFMNHCTDDKLNISKLQRNRALCFMEQKQYEKALEITLEADEKDKSSPQTLFLLHKIYVLMNDNDKAIEAIKRLSHISDHNQKETVHGLICLAAQLSFQRGNRDVAGSILKILVNSYPTENIGNKELLVPLRCLARLKFAFLTKEIEKEQLDLILDIMRKAKRILDDPEQSQNAEQEAEILWFNKLAWNLALSSSNHLDVMEASFAMCYQFSQLLPTSQQSESQQKTCLLMSTGCHLQLSRKPSDDEKDILAQVLSQVSQCYELMKTSPEDSSRSLMENFLILYEFEAKLRLGHTDFDDVFEKVLQVKREKKDIFDKLTNIALQGYNRNKEISLKTLKLTIKCHLETDSPDTEALSKCVHHLINLSLQKGNLTNAESKEDAFDYYQDTLSMLENLQSAFPEMEIVWLMTKAWNCGVHLYSSQHLDAAEKWCSMAIKFLKYLKDLKETYEPHMSSVFADIISKIQQSHAQVAVEE